MKFVTEQELRNDYLKTSFTTYYIAPDMRLTPEARQFLTDRKIILTDQIETEKSVLYMDYGLIDVKFQCLYALFLVVGQQLLSVNPILSQKIFLSGQQLHKILAALHGKQQLHDLEFTPCLGIGMENFSADLGDCFEINAFHAQMKQGLEIILLHQLRCGLRELVCLIQEKQKAGGKNQKILTPHYMFQIINFLSHEICLCMGGVSCQR